MGHLIFPPDCAIAIVDKGDDGYTMNLKATPQGCKSWGAFLFTADWSVWAVCCGRVAELEIIPKFDRKSNAGQTDFGDLSWLEVMILQNIPTVTELYR